MFNSNSDFAGKGHITNVDRELAFINHKYYPVPTVENLKAFFDALLLRDQNLGAQAVEYCRSFIRREFSEEGNNASENALLKIFIAMNAMGTRLNQDFRSYRKDFEFKISKEKLAMNVNEMWKTPGWKSNSLPDSWFTKIQRKKSNFKKEPWFLDLHDLAQKCTPTKLAYLPENRRLEFILSQAELHAHSTRVRDKHLFDDLVKFLTVEHLKGGFNNSDASIQTLNCSPGKNSTKSIIQKLFEGEEFDLANVYTRAKTYESIAKLEELLTLYRKYVDVLAEMKSVEHIDDPRITEETKQIARRILLSLLIKSKGRHINPLIRVSIPLETFRDFVNTFRLDNLAESCRSSAIPGSLSKSVSASGPDESLTEVVSQAESNEGDRCSSLSNGHYYALRNNVEVQENRMQKIIRKWKEMETKPNVATEQPKNIVKLFMSWIKRFVKSLKSSQGILISMDRSPKNGRKPGLFL